MPNFNKEKISLSVGEAVWMNIKDGDIKSSYLILNGAEERLHKKVQADEALKKDDYHPEVSMSFDIKFPECEVSIKGRADGIFFEDGMYTVDEIKSIFSSPGIIDSINKKFALSQAKCYAYMLAKKKDLESVNIRLIYINSESENKKVFHYSFTKDELSLFFGDVIRSCHQYIILYKDHVVGRNESLSGIRFPFKNLRDGQKMLVSEIYKALQDERRAYVNAPTGIGKTMSVLFPAVKALAQNKYDKIFYLTSKNSLNTVAHNAIDILRKNGAKIKAVTITAKRRICFSKSPCLPFLCDFAKGYHERVRSAVSDVFTNEDNMTRDIIESYAKKYTICPFELSLELAELCDIIICDYNYIFDPKAELKGYSDSRFCLLIDEAHNLTERVRNIYSAVLKKDDFLNIKHIFKTISPTLCESAGKIIFLFNKILKAAEDEGDFILYEPPYDLYNNVLFFYDLLRTELGKKSFKDHIGTLGDPESIIYDITEFMHSLSHFIRIFNIFDRSFGAYVDSFGNVNLFCIDTRNIIDKTITKKGNAVFFSATLTPEEYYTEMLAMRDRDTLLSVPSPFTQENLLVLITKTDTRFKERENTAGTISKLIHQTATVKNGNYLVFFPSYEYMKMVYSRYKYLFANDNIIIQSENLTEPERDELLNSFGDTPDHVTIVFAVLGGILSEGIDLIGERLSGAFIVSIGMPQICEEREMIRRYFDEENGEGNNYAYLFPGANKIFQAGGRVIRSENDRGFLLLIDDRFATEEYIEMLPEHWSNYRIIDGDSEAVEILKDFWGI